MFTFAANQVVGRVTHYFHPSDKMHALFHLLIYCSWTAVKQMALAMFYIQYKKLWISISFKANWFCSLFFIRRGMEKTHVR